MKLLLALLLSIGTLHAQEPEVQLPTVVYEAPAVWPVEDAPEGGQAAVRLELDVSDTGRVLEARVLEAPSEAFADAAIEAMDATRFSPATVDGEAVAVTITYLLQFSLDVTARPSVEGIVRQAGTRAPLEGVVVELVGPQDALAIAVSGPDGSFVAYDLAPGPWIVRATGPGIRLDEVPVEVRDDNVVTVKLYANSDRPWEEEVDEEVEVVSRLQAAEVSERRLSTTEAMSLPGSNGDILRAVLNFPGIARPPLGIGQLIVRGTDATDTRYYVDGVRIPQVFHFGGLSTVLNGDVIDDIRFLPGNYSVRYGDALGGTLDLVTRVAAPERSNGFVSIDVYQAAAYIEQRLGDKTDLTLSGRRSYADAVLGPILGSFGGGNSFQAPRYYDAQARVVHRVDGGGVLDALIAFSDDQFRLLGDDDENVAFGLSTTFLTGTLGYRTPTGKGWQSETRVVAGPERQAFTLGGEEAFEEAIALGLRQEVSRPVPQGGMFGWRFGLDLRASAFRFRLGGLAGTPDDEGEGWRVRPALYAENTLRVGALDITTGLRGASMTIPGVTTLWSLDPRLAITAGVGPTTRLVATMGRYSQFPESRELLESSRGNPDVRPSWSLQASLGVSQQLPRGMSIDVTGFYSELNDLVVGREDRFEFTSGPPSPRREDSGDYRNDGSGRVFGGELLFRLSQRRTNVWVAGTVSRATRQAGPGEAETLFAFDQTLVLNALATYTLPKRWTLGGRVRVGTGNPYTPIVNRVQDASSRGFIPIFGTEQERVRTFWALDIRIDKEWVFKKWALTLYLDIQGITDGGNTELIGYSYDYATEQPIRSTPPLPAFGLKGSW